MSPMAAHGVDGGAIFGPEGPDSPYRYSLWRTVGADPRAVAFIMLNPSTATHTRLDPTVRRCIAFARAWGFGKLFVGNLYALRATDPVALYLSPDPVGPENDDWLETIALKSGLVVCAWGVHGGFKGRGNEVAAMLRKIKPVHALKFTRRGDPSHPLYLPGNLKPAIWGAA